MQVHHAGDHEIQHVLPIQREHPGNQVILQVQHRGHRLSRKKNRHTQDRQHRLLQNMGISGKGTARSIGKQHRFSGLNDITHDRLREPRTFLPHPGFPVSALCSYSEILAVAIQHISLHRSRIPDGRLQEAADSLAFYGLRPSVELVQRLFALFRHCFSINNCCSRFCRLLARLLQRQ
ncbi:hypothetical protein D3C81_1592940 [compost metagenome]